MAVTVASLQAVLDLDEKKFNRGLKSADKALDNFESQLPELIDSIERLTEKMDKFGNEAKESLEDAEAGADNALGGISNLVAGLNPLAVLGGVILGGLAAAVVGIGTAAISASKEFGGAMRQIEARTGKTGAELQDLGEVTKEVFVDNWGDSLADAADAVIAVNQVLGLTGDAAKEAAEGALILRDVFGIDIDASVRAARSAVESFGVTNEQVMDGIAKVFQDVGDPAGDLADTINEYSTIFANAGFSFEEFLGLLEGGVAQGARNFDQVADAWKEFIISIEQGGPDVIEAINKIFREIGEGDQTFFELEDAIGDVDRALADNKRALEESEGAYKAQRQVLDELQSALSDAKRELDAMARPNLKGMEEFDDKLFDLEQQTKRAELALTKLELQGTKDSKAFEQTQGVLERLNLEYDALATERDLIFDEQLRKIDKAIMSGTDNAVSLEEQLGKIADKKGHIGLLEDSITNAVDTMIPLETAFVDAQLRNEELTAEAQRLQDTLAATKSPAEELLGGLEDGSMSVRDVIAELVDMMVRLDDSTQQAVGPILFKTKWEDAGEAIMASVANGIPALEDYAGAASAAGDAVSGGPWNAFQQALREIQIALIPLGDLFANLAEEHMPAFQGVIDWLVATGIPALVDVVAAIVEGIDDLLVQLGLAEAGIDTFATNAVASIDPLASQFAQMSGDTEDMGGHIGAINSVFSNFGTLIERFTPAMTAFTGALTGVNSGLEWLDGLLEGIAPELDTTKIVFDGILSAVLGIVSPFTNIAKSVSDMVALLPRLNEGWGTLKDTWSGLDIPDWLKPGSPTPLELGLVGINKAISQLPNLSQGLGGLAAVAGGGNGSSNVTVNIGGVSATTNTTGNANDEAIRMTLQMLRSQLESAG